MIADPAERHDLATAGVQFEQLQTQMLRSVYSMRRPNDSARRPYDYEFQPAFSSERLQTSPGVRWRRFEVSVPWTPKVDGWRPATEGVVATINPALLEPGRDGVIEFTGMINVPHDGEYQFQLKAGAGALLRIHQATVIDADFGTPTETRQGTVGLSSGRHPFQLIGRCKSDERSPLALQWSDGKSAFHEIPADVLSHDNAERR